MVTVLITTTTTIHALMFISLHTIITTTTIATSTLYVYVDILSLYYHSPPSFCYSYITTVIIHTLVYLYRIFHVLRIIFVFFSLFRKTGASGASVLVMGGAAAYAATQLAGVSLTLGYMGIILWGLSVWALKYLVFSLMALIRGPIY